MEAVRLQPALGLPHRAQALWLRGIEEDHFTSSNFLNTLVINSTVPPRSYANVVRSALAVVHQLASVGTALSIAFHLYQVRILWCRSMHVHHAGSAAG
jgi:hypothetical protein